jgi:hypothetical protein
MAFGYVKFTADGLTNTWAFSFSYLDASHIKVYVDGVEDVSRTLPTLSSVQTSYTPTAGAAVVIKRVTPRTTLVYAVPTSGSLRNTDLNNQAFQALYVAGEAHDYASTALQLDGDTLTYYNAGSKLIKNVTDPVDAQDVATKNYIDTDLNGSVALAEGFANDAEDAALAAAASESNASDSEAAAVAAAEAAALSEDNAADYETGAEAAETGAEAAEDAALGYASAAAASAGEATASAGNAQGYASLAQAAQTAAEGARDDAEAAETSAEDAQAAAESAKAAAEVAQGLAEAAQTGAEAAYDSFDDRYLGAKATDPTLDNDGDALLTGALYFNTSSGLMQVYDGAAWGGLGTDLAALADVTISSVTNGEVLRYDGSGWINNTLAEAGISAVGHTHTFASLTSKPTTLAGYGITDGATDSELSAAVANSGNWDTAYSWGDHAGLYADASHTHTASEITDFDTEVANNTTVAANTSKLAGIEAGADVTDTANVTAAGALMDSEVTNLAAVKAFDPADYAAASHTHVIADVTDFTDNSTNWDTAYGWGDHAGLYAAASHTHVMADITDLTHDGLTGYVANEHIDWTNATVKLETTGHIETAGGDIIIDQNATTDSKIQFHQGTGNFNLLYKNTGETGGAHRVGFADGGDNFIFYFQWGSGSTHSYHFDGTGTFNVAGNANFSSGVDVTGDITVTGTVDGVDIASRDADLTTAEGKLATIETNADVTDTANVTAAGALMDSEVTNLAAVKAFDPADYAAASHTHTASDITDFDTEVANNTTVAANTSKLAGIEAGADVTDTANVTAAGALMDSEVTNLAAVKAFDPTDYVSSSGGTLTGDLEVTGVITAHPKNTEGAIQLGSGDNQSGDFVVSQIRFGYNGVSSIQYPQWISTRHSGAGNRNAIVFDTGDGTAAGVYGTNNVFGMQVKGGAVQIGGTENTGALAYTLDVQGDAYIDTDLTVGGTVDGRDVAADGSKLDGIEAGADVTDTANVTAAGALMDSEVTNLAAVKAFDPTDYAAASHTHVMADITDLTHDGLTGFVANEHIDWTSTSSSLVTSGNVTAADVTATDVVAGRAGDFDETLYVGSPTQEGEIVRIQHKTAGDSYLAFRDGIDRLRIGWDNGGWSKTGADPFAAAFIEAYGDLVIGSRGNYTSGLEFYTSPAGTGRELALRLDDDGTADFQDGDITTTGTLTADNISPTALDAGVQVPVGSLDSGTGASASTFWRGDGTWAVPAAASHTHAASDITSGTFADARIAESNVTQHEAALSIETSQITDYGGPIRPEWYGAVGDGTTDDYTAIAAALAAAGDGGEVLLTGKYRVGTTLAVPLGCTLSGLNRNPHNYNMEDLADGGSVILLDGVSITLTTDSALFGLTILPYGETFPANQTAVGNWSGIGVNLLGAHAGHSITHCAIGGFEYGIVSAAASDTSNITITDCLMDNINGIILEQAYDICYITRVHMEPGLSRGLTDADSERTGKGIVLTSVSDWTKITDCFVFGYNRGIELYDVNSCTLTGCGVDYVGSHVTNSAPWGIVVTDACTETVITNCQVAAQDKGFVLQSTATYSMTKLVNCTAWACDTVGFDISDGHATLVACQARQCGTGFDSITGTADAIRLSNCTAQACTLGIDNTSGLFQVRDPIYLGNTTHITGGGEDHHRTGIFYAHDYGFYASNSGTANKTALEAAVAAAAAAGGGTIKIKAGNFTLAPVSITDNHIKIEGAGMWATKLIHSTTTGDLLNFNSCQHSGVEELCISGANTKITANYLLAFSTDSFQNYAYKVRLEYGYNGIYVNDTSSCWIKNIQLRYMTGTRGIHVLGTSGQGTYGFRADYIDTDNPYPQAYGSFRGDWAGSTAYALNDIVANNGLIWQCSSAGTSASSGGPSSQPGTNGIDAFTTTVSDGSVSWKFVSAQLVWFYQDGYAYSLSLDNSALLNGYRGLVIGSDNAKWFNSQGLEIDHSYQDCIYMSGGQGAWFTHGWFGSAMRNTGVLISGFDGEAVFHSCRIVGNGTHGILLQAGSKDITIEKCTIAANGQIASNTYWGIAVGAGATHFKILGNTIGWSKDATGQQYGALLVNSGASDYYIIRDNIVTDNVTTGVVDSGSGSNKYVGNNY